MTPEGGKMKELFFKTIKDHIKRNLGDDYDIKLQNVKKINRTLVGLSIRKKDTKLAPTFYLDAMYEQFTKREITLEEIVKKILSEFNECSNKNFSVDTDIFFDFNQVSKNIFCKLIDKEKNESLLFDVPHMEFLDLAAVFYICIEKNEDKIVSSLITNRIFEYWNISKEKLIFTAINNTPKMFGIELLNVEQMMVKLFMTETGENEETAKKMLGLSGFPSQGCNLFVLTNDYRNGGATLLLYSEIFKNFAHKMHVDKVVIIPSSVHELLLLPIQENENILQNLNGFIKEMNQGEVAPEDVLIDHAYVYHLATDNITIM